MNVGAIGCDSINIDDATIGLDIVFGGNTSLNKISLTDNLADALSVTESSNSYMKFVTTNNTTGRYLERIITNKDLETSENSKVKQLGACLQSSTHQSLLMGY
jgi:hypothetical protein